MSPRGLLRAISGKRGDALALCCALLIGLVAMRCAGAERSGPIPAAKVDQSVMAALSRQGITKPKVIAHIDLTRPFASMTQWTFVAVQEGGSPSTPMEDHGPVFVCLVKAAVPDCAEHYYQPVSGDEPWFETPYHLLASRIVYARPDKSYPLLLVQVCTAESIDGNCGIATALYRYDRGADRFTRVFLSVTGRNNNEDTCFVERGPLEGDVIVNYPTEHAPYTYWIEVYGAGRSSRYVRILRYRGRTGYNDGNPLAVPDSEMPEILRRLGLWKPGDALPAPAHLPQGCRRLSMRRGEEWCK